MRQHGLISTIWKSFYDPSVYQDVKENWGFNVVPYLFILALIYTLLAAFHEHAKLTDFFNTFSEKVTYQIPTGKLDHGTMTMNKTSPYTIYLTEKNKAPQAVAIFDMTNKVTPTDTTDSVIIFHSNGYFYDKNAPYKSAATDTSKTKSFEFQTYPSTKSLSFSAAQAKILVDKFLMFLPVLFFIMAGLLQFIFKIVQPIIYAFIVMIFGGFCKIHFTYGQAYRLAAVATTPAFIVIALPKLFFNIPHPWLIAFILELVYLYFAAYANRQPRQA